jgi:hypothetical protein
MIDLMSMLDDIKLETSGNEAEFEDEDAAKCVIDIFVREMEWREEAMGACYFFPNRDEWQSRLKDRIEAEYQRRKKEREAKEGAGQKKMNAWQKEVNAWIKRMREEERDG